MGQNGSRGNRPGVRCGPNNSGQALVAGGTNAALLTQAPHSGEVHQCSHQDDINAMDDWKWGQDTVVPEEVVRKLPPLIFPPLEIDMVDR